MRASEIGDYVYCARAWWYARQGVPSEAHDDQVAGGRWHERLSRRAVITGALRALGLACIGLAVLLVLVGFLTRSM